MDKAIDRTIAAIINGIALIARIVILGIPVIVFCPLMDFFTCWRFLITAKGVKFINDGNVNASNSELRASGYNLTDGTTVFNAIDILIQIIYVPICFPFVLVTVLVDVFSCNQAKATSSMVPCLSIVIKSERECLQAITGAKINWVIDSLWKDCLGEGVKSIQPPYESKTVEIFIAQAVVEEKN